MDVGSIGLSLLECRAPAERTSPSDLYLPRCFLPPNHTFDSIIQRSLILPPALRRPRPLPGRPPLFPSSMARPTSVPPPPRSPTTLSAPAPRLSSAHLLLSTQDLYADESAPADTSLIAGSSAIRGPFELARRQLDYSYHRLPSRERTMFDPFPSRTRALPAALTESALPLHSLFGPTRPPALFVRPQSARRDCAVGPRREARGGVRVRPAPGRA